MIKLGVCKACASSCGSCSGPLSEDCVSCSSPLLLQPTGQLSLNSTAATTFKAKCQPVCATGYVNTTAPICQPCTTNCDSCLSPLFFFKRACYTTCPKGTELTLNSLNCLDQNQCYYYYHFRHQPTHQYSQSQNIRLLQFRPEIGRWYSSSVH